MTHTGQVSLAFLFLWARVNKALLERLSVCTVVCVPASLWRVWNVQGVVGMSVHLSASRRGRRRSRLDELRGTVNVRPPTS